MLTFEELLNNPPLKTTTITLPDKRQVQLYELPLSVMKYVQSVGREGEDGVSHVMDSITLVATQALMGRPPQQEDMDAMSERFGTTAVMFIYYEALKFSRLGPDALEETKKH